MDDTTGTLDEALERIHVSGPERDGWLSNHAPMAVEALVRHGQASAVHRWLDRYGPKLEEMPVAGAPVTGRNWHEALGDPRRVADWTAYFERDTARAPWRDVLAAWWPRLLPGIAAGATHPVIRVGHSVRTLLTGEETAPRVRELAHALGYWAARHQPLPALTPLGPAPSAAAALDLVPLVPEQSGGIRERFAQLTGFPEWPAQPGRESAAPRPAGPEPAHREPVGPESAGPVRFGPELASAEAARSALRELVRASTHRYATHAHGEPIMLVHAATAPNAVLRTLPALPRELWAPSLRAAWAASAAVTAAYAPREAAPVPASAGAPPDAGELFARAAAHGDDHTIKFTDTALDVGDALAFSAARHAIELNPPVFG
ncbi:questin oxidase family protein [Streptomyces sp. JUS-F4]|uniref:questin oxidase family protein n=1 Tax=Streptomyces sp. JUS-F4 TaxID=2951988 RepID=UPI00266503DB|nr:questin oxidase family protein [Streptomyces sp. JUS-F4]WKN15328.1 questin oxidase family protein [Streptomyces sp. JUS-F4]